jgi:ribose transport system substrate-binding protein
MVLTTVETAGLAAKYPGLKLVADKVADGMATTALLIMGQGAGEAVAGSKAADKIKLVAFDSDDKTVKFLKAGTIAALVVQDPFRMGYEGVKTAFAASKGEKVPATVDTGANLITQENMNSPRFQELLSPKT